jgi:short-subunit dehydrogenase
VVGRTAVVTGASRGIGRQVAWRLAAVGARVVGLARGADRLAEVRARARERGLSFDFRAVDLRDSDAAGRTAHAIIDTFGPPDLVICCAGHSIHRYLAEYAERFHDVFRLAGVNYLGAVAVLAPLADQMARRGAGHIVSVSTTAADVPTPGWSAYGASHAAFDAWLDAVAGELRAAGVAVSSLHLPRVATAMSAPTAGRYPVPELTLNQAADAVCRVIVRRPRLVRPWWATAAGGAVHALPHLADRLWSSLLRAGVRP